jgi:hypothetical protein
VSELIGILLCLTEIKAQYMVFTVNRYNINEDIIFLLPLHQYYQIKTMYDLDFRKYV